MRIEDNSFSVELPQIARKLRLNEINFTTLKQRHDNFSFEKTLESRPKVYNSIHFESRNKTSQEILFFPKKQQTQKAANQSDLSRMLSLSTLDAAPSEAALWQDFKAHFKRTNRNAKGTHRDFMTQSLEVRQQQPTMLDGDVGARYLQHNHKQRALDSYIKLKETSITVPQPSPKVKNIEKMVKRARYKLQAKKSQEQLIEQNSVSEEKELIEKNFPKRHIYFIIDGQNVSELSEVTFQLIEINESLARFVPDKIWRLSKRMDFYQRVELSKPSLLMQEQNLLEILHEIQRSLGRKDSDKEQVKYAFTIDGRQVKSLMDLHQKCRIVIVSRSKQFRGLVLEGSEQQICESVKPLPGSWITNAASRWQLTKIAPDSSTQHLHSPVSHKLLDQDTLQLNSVEQEHIKVHEENQILLSRISLDPVLQPQASHLQLSVDFEAFSTKHSYAVAYKDIPYGEQAREQQIIDWLLKKIVLMREKPLLEKQKSILIDKALIDYDQQHQRIKKLALTARKVNKSMIQTVHPLQGFGGYAESTRNKATFKVTTEEVPQSKRKEMGMLPDGEVKRISETNKITRAEVYRIRAIFASMTKLSRHTGSKGLNIDFFIKNCSFLNRALPDIAHRVLKASGLDTDNSRAVVDWDTFLKLYCIFEAGSVERAKLIQFWIKFFDINLKGVCPEEEYLDILEKLIRGVCMKQKSEFTTVFASNYQQSMQECGILNEDRSIVIDLLQRAFEDGKLDISQLSASLGGKRSTTKQHGGDH